MGDSFSCSSKANQHPEINLEAKSSDLKETQMPMFESHDQDVPIGRQDELLQPEINLEVNSPDLAQTQHDLDVPMQQFHELEQPDINLEANPPDLAEIPQRMSQSHDQDIHIAQKLDELQESVTNPKASSPDLTKRKRRLVALPPSFWEMFQSWDQDVPIQQLDELQVCDEKEPTQRNKWSPLHIATVRSSVRKIKKLIEAGTNPDAR